MKITSVLAVAIGMTTAANAAIILPTAITYTGSNPEETGINLDDENQLIDGSGLNGVLLTEANIATTPHDNITFGAPGNGWVTTAPNGTGDFFADGGAQGTVVFDIQLGATYDVASFYNWSYDFSEVNLNGNNIKAITLEYGVGDYASSLGNFDLSPVTADDIPTKTVLSEVITADRIRITVTDNFFGEVGFQGGDRVGAAEFAFSTIPEPSSSALLGLGGLALILRRRK